MTQLLSPADAAAALGQSPKTLANWRSRHEGPPFCKVGSSVRYPADLLERWVAARIDIGDGSVELPVAPGRGSGHRRARAPAPNATRRRP